MPLQRKHFAKGYITSGDDDTRYIRAEESYDGQFIEITVGDNDFVCGCQSCDDCEPCNPTDFFRIRLDREQVQELQFIIKQLHFIDKERITNK